MVLNLCLSFMQNDLDSAMVQMNSDLKRLHTAAIEHSLNINTSKTAALLFGRMTGCNTINDSL